MLILMVFSVNALVINKFTNGLSSESILYTTQENYTRYVSIPLDANITSATLNIDGRSNGTYKNISIQSIQEWMYKNPIKGKIIREKNDRYIFFKFRKEGGHSGASGVELTAGHSAAVDKNFIPYHIPIWVGNLLEENFTNQPNLFVSQDAGRRRVCGFSL